MIEVWNKIDYEEECTDVDEYLDEDEEAGEEDVNTDTLTETENASEQSLCDSDVMEEKEDYS
ncbi:GTP-binding protein HflX, partial [Trifolium medium]|nr:GTP-binding protein HflX [Trifolium medium]